MILCDSCRKPGETVQLKLFRQIPFSETVLGRLDLCGECYANLAGELREIVERYNRQPDPVTVVKWNGWEPPF